MPAIPADAVRPSLTIQPLTLEDVPTMCEIEELAFAQSPVAALMYPNGRGASTPDSMAYRFRKVLNDPSKAYAHPLKVVRTDTGDMVTFGVWIRPLTAEERQDVKNKAAAGPDPEAPVDDAMDKEFMSAFRREMAASHERTMGHRPHWYLELLVTHPRHQGIGAGGAIIRWGFDKAREDKVTAYLESSAAGFKLYEHMGFKTIGEVRVWDGKAVLPCMEWTPEGL
ncbi:hypothetical protein HDU87_002001 [Geranomyces variabilis]|uniref:N-acetyltransferase domain-containing protein n=1 Tax=Geranomyces variabilis TaxID=109894 RepID=A0AAD5TLR7_9FUNG|nr:hypothetical protein HDU87_002001 [Geranomyces variabilis]